jgi:hypothetical protein
LVDTTRKISLGFSRCDRIFAIVFWLLCAMGKKVVCDDLAFLALLILIGYKAGCVPVKKGEDGEWKVLMVQSRFKPEIWLFPKGGIEKKEKNWDAACRETVEVRLGCLL